MKKRQIFIQAFKAIMLIIAVSAMLPVYVHASYSVGEFSGYFPEGPGGRKLLHTLTISHNGTLNLSFTYSGYCFDSTMVTVWNPDKSDIIGGDAFVYKSYTHDNLSPGTYYIQVETKCQPSYGTYTIQAAFTNADDSLTESEPNDTIDAAKPLTNNQVTGILGYTDGINTDYEDWFRYEVTHSGKLDLSVTYSGYNLDSTSVSVWKPDKSGIIGGTTFAGKSYTHDHLTPGTYYIQVKRHGQPSYGTYTIQAAFTNADDSLTESEPNDTIDAAKPLTNNQVTGILGYTDGINTDYEDWFRYEVTRSGKLVLNFTYTGLSYAGVYLWKPDKSGYITSASMSAKSLTRDKLAPGTYYIQVKQSYGQYGTYTIQPAFTPDVSALGLQDVIVCLRILSGIPVSSSEIIITDISKDGRIGMEECVYILQVVAGLRP